MARKATARAGGEPKRQGCEPRSEVGAGQPQESVACGGDGEGAVGEVQHGASDRGAFGLVAVQQRRVGDAAAGQCKVEFLGLLVEGLSDRELAERLCISAHTVHRHVSNILTKLDLPSRAAAAAFGARHGLGGPSPGSPSGCAAARRDRFDSAVDRSVGSWPGRRLPQPWFVIFGSLARRAAPRGRCTGRGAPAAWEARVVTCGMKPRIDRTRFGSVTIDGTVFEHDVIIRLHGQVKKRKKRLSKAVYGTSHTISLAEA